MAPAESRSSPLDKQQPNPKSHGPQSLGGGHLGGEDALGVADAAAVQKLLILAEGNVGRNGIHVRGKDQIGRLAGRARIDIPARAAAGVLRRLRNGSLLYGPAAPDRNPAENRPPRPRGR